MTLRVGQIFYSSSPSPPTWSTATRSIQYVLTSDPSTYLLEYFSPIPTLAPALMRKARHRNDIRKKGFLDYLSPKSEQDGG
jgi:hypothetical protein